MKFLFLIFVRFLVILTAQRRRNKEYDVKDKVLAGVLDHTNTAFCVFGPIRKDYNNNTFSFDSKLCIDADQRIYTCPNGLELDFKKIWNCDNFVIQEQISGKCLLREKGMYYLGSCNTCLNNSFFNLTDKCLKPSLNDTIGALLCDEIAEATRMKIANKKGTKPLCKLFKIQKQTEDEVEDIIKPLGLRDMIKRIQRQGKEYDRMVAKPMSELMTERDCRDYMVKRREITGANKKHRRHYQ